MKKLSLATALVATLITSACATNMHHDHHHHDMAIDVDTIQPSIVVDMVDLTSEKSVGTIGISQTKYGVVFTPNLTGVSGGLHGFHVHENPSCAPVTKNGKTVLGLAAGGHYDPMKTGKHGYPWSDDNHLGDLPALYVDMNKTATNPVLAPKLALKDLKGRSLMIHVGGDNYSDDPKPLGGGGARMVCGVIN